MDDFVLSIFQLEVERQCRWVRLAAVDLNAALHVHDSDRCWASLAALLTAAANVSKLLWGGKGGLKAARRPLRESLGVNDEDSPLYSRRLRNLFEHFDEKIDEWASVDPDGTYVDSNIGPMSLGIPRERWLRHFDPDTATVTFRGETFELQPLVDAATELERTAAHATALRFGH